MADLIPRLCNPPETRAALSLMGGRQRTDGTWLFLELAVSIRPSRFESPPQPGLGPRLPRISGSLPGPGSVGGFSPACARRMKLSELVFILSVGLCAAQGPKLDGGEEAAIAAASGCCNLTQILETWRSSIMAQVKDLLLHHHQTVLPDYSRIAPMSASLQTLNQELNETRQDVEELRGAFGGFRGLLRMLSSGHNVSRTSGGFIRRIVKKRPVINAGKILSRRIVKKIPGSRTGQVISNQPRKKVRIPRLRMRPAGSRAQRNSSPRIFRKKPAWG